MCIFQYDVCYVRFEISEKKIIDNNFIIFNDTFKVEPHQFSFNKNEYKTFRLLNTIKPDKRVNGTTFSLKHKLTTEENNKQVFLIFDFLNIFKK